MFPFFASFSCILFAWYIFSLLPLLVRWIKWNPMSVYVLQHILPLNRHHLKRNRIEPGSYIPHYPLLYYPFTLELGLWQTYKLFSFFSLFVVRSLARSLWFLGALFRSYERAYTKCTVHPVNGEGCFKRLLDYHWCEYNIHYVLKYMCSQFLFVSFFCASCCFRTFHQKACTAKRQWHFYTDMAWIGYRQKEQQ